MGYMKILVDFSTGTYSFNTAKTLEGPWKMIATTTDSQLTSGDWHFTFWDNSGFWSNKFKLLNGQGCQKTRGRGINFLLAGTEGLAN